MTANVWVRGMLEEEYGVKPRDIKWRRGGLEEPGREERARINLPPRSTSSRCRTTARSPTCWRRARSTALISARAPSCFLRGAPNVGRLFPDYPAVEEAYFKKTKLFPIMHAIGIRRSLVEKYPWVAVNVYKAFIKAKALCMHELAEIGHLHATLPWPVHAYDHARKVMGEDYWPYGVHENKHAAGNAGALFVRAGPVGAAGAARRDVRQADL